MGERIFAIIGAVFMTFLLAVHSPATLAQTITEPKTEAETPPVPWSKVPDTERRVLLPLEKDWAQLPAGQQRKLISAAKKYSTLAPIQQQRFQERLKEWASLTPAQRHAARDKYRNLSSLPPEKQSEIREKWLEKANQAKDPVVVQPDSPPK